MSAITTTGTNRLIVGISGVPTRIKNADTLVLDLDSIQFTDTTDGTPVVFSNGVEIAGILSIADNHIALNDAYTIVVAKTGGFVVNYLPTVTTTTTAGAGVFTAGVDGATNPTVTTAAAATFSASDLVMISGFTPNNGIYEVVSHAANLLTIRSTAFGITNQIEDWTNDQFVTLTNTGATLTKCNFSVLRAGADGLWETGFGSATPITFTDVALINYVTESRNATTENAVVKSPVTTADILVFKMDGAGQYFDAFVVGSDSDGTAVGGNARGAGAIELGNAIGRTADTQVASGAKSAIVGGYELTASAIASIALGGNLNVASGIFSSCVGGDSNITSASNSACVGGAGSTVAGFASAIVGGSAGSTASGWYQVILGGEYNSAPVDNSVAMGASGLSDHPCGFAFSGNKAAPSVAERGKSQGQLIHLDGETTDGSSVNLASYSPNVAPSPREIVIPSNGALSYTGTVTAWNETDGTVSSWLVSGACSNPSGTPALAGNVETVITAGHAGTLAVSIVSGATDYLRFAGTGIAAKTIRWSASLLFSRAVT